MAPASMNADTTRRALEDAAVAASCTLGLTFGADVSSEHPEIAARGEAVLHDALRFTAAIGARYLGGVVHSALGKYDRPLSEQARDGLVTRLRRVAAAAAMEAVTIGLKVVNRYESNVLNTAADALSLIEDIGEPNVVVHLDTFHMNIEETDLETPVLGCGDRLGYVHVGESHRGLLGTGTIDFGPLFAALRRVGYGGTIAFESFSSAVVSEGLTNVLGVWRDLWDDSAEVAAHAYGFITEQVRRAAATAAPAP